MTRKQFLTMIWLQQQKMTWPKMSKMPWSVLDMKIMRTSWWWKMIFLTENAMTRKTKLNATLFMALKGSRPGLTSEQRNPEYTWLGPSFIMAWWWMVNHCSSSELNVSRSAVNIDNMLKNLQTKHIERWLKQTEIFEI